MFSIPEFPQVSLGVNLDLPIPAIPSLPAIPTPTASDLELGNIAGGFDNIGSAVTEKFGAIRSHVPDLDDSLSGFATLLSDSTTGVGNLGTAADEGLTAAMDSMQKESLSACAALGLNVNGMFGSFVDNIKLLGDGLIFKPINAVVKKVKEWFDGLPKISFDFGEEGEEGFDWAGLVEDIGDFVTNVKNKIGEFTGKITGAINKAIEAVGDVMEDIYRLSGLKDLATGIMGGINGIIGCGEDFIGGLGGISPAIMEKNPVMKIASDAATHAEKVKLPSDGIGDVITEAKNKAVATLGLDTMVDTALSAGAAIKDGIMGLVTEDPDIGIDIPDVPMIPGVVYA